MRTKEEVMAAIELYNRENKKIASIQIAVCVLFVLGVLPIAFLFHAGLGLLFLCNILFSAVIWAQGLVWSENRLRRKFGLLCPSCGWLFPAEMSFEDVLAPRLCQNCHQPLFKYD